MDRTKLAELNLTDDEVLLVERVIIHGSFDPTDLRERFGWSLTRCGQMLDRLCEEGVLSVGGVFQGPVSEFFAFQAEREARESSGVI